MRFGYHPTILPVPSRVGPEVIRFNCPHCQREYILHDALFGLPLVCKGCGQRLSIPAPEPEPPPIPEPVEMKAASPPPPDPKPFTPEPPTTKRFVIQPESPKQVAPPDDEVDPGFLSPETIAQLDKPVETPTQPKVWEKPVTDKPQPKPTPPAAPKVSSSPSIPRSKIIGIAADVVVVLLLLVVGIFLGELAAGKSTSEVMQLASGPKFPPLELLMWLAGPVVLLLVYALLGSRGKTVGVWLRKRMQG
jgi:hypothetical protein